MLSMKEAIENYVEGCVGKVECPAYKLFIKAILAGMMIAFGAAGSSVAAHDIANVGLARLVAGVVFPMGLMMVVMTGAELFTGDCLAIMATVQKKHTALKLIRMLVVVYFGNLLGSLMLTCIDYVSGQYNYSSGILGAYTIKVALGKCNLDFTTALASGILCNILVCAAVMLAARAKDVTGKLLCCFFIILLFVVSGYEHCVANMYYVPAGMIAKLNPLYVKDAMEQYGYTAQQLSTLNIPNYIFNNMPEPEHPVEFPLWKSLCRSAGAHDIPTADRDSPDRHANASSIQRMAYGFPLRHCPADPPLPASSCS